MADYLVEQAQNTYNSEFTALQSNGTVLSEPQQASLFAKILIKQTDHPNANILFCSDSELFVSKTPTGYDVVGYYLYNSEKKPFSITVCKINDLWYPSKRHVAADTKSCSSSIALWILLTLGCTLMGILMYYLISAAIGI